MTDTTENEPVEPTSPTSVSDADELTIDANDTPKLEWYKNWKTWLKITAVLIIVIAIILAIVYNKQTLNALTTFLEWMENHPAGGAFAFIGVYWFCTVFFIPGSLLTFGAGFVFSVVAGPWAGVFVATLVVFVGASLGATTAFILGRFVFRDSVAGYKKKYKKFDIIDRVVKEQGLKVTLLLRLSPIIPFNVFNYVMGLTAVSFRDYNIAHVGMLPGTIAYCFIGSTLGAIGSVGLGDNPLVLVLTIVGTVIAIVGMVYISFVAKREFKKIAEYQNEENEVETDLEVGTELTGTNDVNTTNNDTQSQENENNDNGGEGLDNDNDGE